MSDQHHSKQLELFPDPTMPPIRGSIAGLTVHLDRHCGCGSTIWVIVEGRGPHAAAMKCPDCGRLRQWLPRKVFRFLVELVATFGRPTEPVEIYEQVNRTG